MLKFIAIVDTNAIHTSSPKELLNEKTRSLIESYRSRTDVSVIWCIPEVVCEERIYQMRSVSRKLRREIESRLERLKNDFGIEAPPLPQIDFDGKVSELVQAECERLGLQRLELNRDEVPWDEMIRSATRRRPPFDAEKEKGFRDALIMHTSLQAAARAPSGAYCVAVTEDQLLVRAFREQPRGRNIELVSKIEELDSYIASKIVPLPDPGLMDEATALFLEMNNGQFREGRGGAGLFQEHVGFFSQAPAGYWHEHYIGSELAPARFDKVLEEHDGIGRMVIRWRSDVTVIQSISRFKEPPPLLGLKLQAGSMGAFAMMEEQKEAEIRNYRESMPRLKFVRKAVISVPWTSSWDGKRLSDARREDSEILRDWIEPAQDE